MRCTWWYDSEHFPSVTTVRKFSNKYHKQKIFYGEAIDRAREKKESQLHCTITHTMLSLLYVRKVLRLVKTVSNTHVTSCHVTSWHVTRPEDKGDSKKEQLRNAKLFYSFLLHFTMSLLFFPCSALSCPVLSCPVLSCPVLSCIVLFNYNLHYLSLTYSALPLSSALPHHSLPHHFSFYRTLLALLSLFLPFTALTWIA